MRKGTQVEYKILKIVYIIILLLILIPFAAHIYYDLHNELHAPFEDLGDLLGVLAEVVAIFLLGLFGTRSIRKLIKENKEIEEKYQKEKEEMNNKIVEDVMEIQEKERKRVSRELHDGIGQNLSVVKMNLEMILQRKLKSSKYDSSRDIKGIIDLTSNSIQELKKLSMDVRPSILDDLGLVPALRWYIKNCSISKGPKIVFDEAISCKLSPSIETNIYRIAQEAISNALKHSKANTINVFIKTENKELFLSIKDNGKGFEPEKYLNGVVKGTQLGIISMKERVTLMDGVFSIKSRPGKGTDIEIKIPTLPDGSQVLQ